MEALRDSCPSPFHRDEQSSARWRISGPMGESSLQANGCWECGWWACLAKLAFGTCLWITMSFLDTTDDQCISIHLKHTFCWKQLYGSELPAILPSDYCICIQPPKVTRQYFISALLFFGHLTKLNRPFSMSASFFLMLEAKSISWKVAFIILSKLG